MSLTIPITFATRTGELQLSYLDENFTYLKTQLDTTNTTATATNATITNILTQLTVLGSSTTVGDVLYVDDSNNRVGIKQASPTVELDVNGAVKASSLALTTPLPTSSGGLGASTASGVGGWLDNILPAGENSGYVLTTTGVGSYQWAAVGATSGNIGTKIDTTRQTFTATSGQTVFDLTSITYTPGSGQLRVYVDGVRQFPAAYTETDNNTFTLSTGVTAGVSVFAEIDGYVSYPISAADVSYTPAGGSTISALTIQNAISELEQEKVGVVGQATSLGVGTPASGVTGEIRATNNITAYYTSDRNLKENIVTIENALDKMDSIRGVYFDWTDEIIERRGGIDKFFTNKNDIGVIAQEVESVLPEVVRTNSEGYKAVRYELMIPLLIQAIKELKDEIETLKAR